MYSGSEILFISLCAAITHTTEKNILPVHGNSGNQFLFIKFVSSDLPVITDTTEEIKHPVNAALFTFYLSLSIKNCTQAVQFSLLHLAPISEPDLVFSS